MQLGRSPARIRLFLVAVATLIAATSARADEQRVSRFGIAISAQVTTLSPSLINDGIDVVNNSVRVIGENNNAIPRPISHIKASAFFQVEGRFFISDKLAAVAGFGRISRTSQLELLPGAQRRLLMKAQILGVPRHLGLNYYMTPYTRGDMTLRPYFGGGFMDVVEAHGRVGAEFESPDTTVSQFQRSRGEGPGFYAEAGVHMMLPSRYSFMASINYHHIAANRLILEDAHGNTFGYLTDADGNPEKLDFSGVGLKFAVNMNLFNKF